MIVRFEDVITRVTGNVDRYNTDLEYYVGGDQYDSSALTIERRGNLKKDVDILGFKFHFPFKSGDVLLMARNPHLRKAGQVFFDGLCSDASYILRTKNPEVLLQDYIPILLQRDHFWDFFESHKTGGITFLMNWGMLKTYEFDLPPIEKQREVMEKVWAAYRLKQSYQKLIEATDEMVKSRFIEMFGGIQNGRKWPLKKLSEICHLVNGYAFKSALYSNEGFSVIRIANVQKGYIDNSDRAYYPVHFEKEFKDSILQKGDILISLTGNVGRVGVITDKHLPAALNQRVQGLRLRKGIPMSNDFLFCVLNLDEFESLCIENASGSAQLNLSTIWVRNFQIICPPFDKQREFTQFANQADKSKYLN